MKYVIPAAIAIAVGLVTLLGYLIAIPELQTARVMLTDWAVVLAALAVLVGVINLLLVHTRRIQSGDRGSIYSLLTILAVLLTLLIGVFESRGTEIPSLYQKPSVINSLFEGVIVASQATLASLVMIFLVVAAMRMLRSKPNVWSVVFVVVVVIVLIGWVPLIQMGIVSRLRQWLLSVPVAAGARGILLGVALGTLAIGLRVLTGAERPYKD